MKEIAPSQAKQPAQQLENEGGQSMSPPAFGLSANPVQAKMGAEPTAQLKKGNDRSSEQEALRQEFEAYRDIKCATIQDPAAKASFINQANAFIAWADERTGVFNGDQNWGNKDYQKRLKNNFGDYTAVVQGKIAEVKSHALQDAQAALSTAKGAVARAQIALDLATSNTAEAEKAATEAETEALKAEASAKTAEANALLPDAGEPEKAAAKKARAAADAARAAANAAKKAVETARASQDLAGAQKSFAAAQIDQAEAIVSSNNSIKDLQSAYHQEKGAAGLRTSAESMPDLIDLNSKTSEMAKTNAQSSAGSAKNQAEIAHAEENNSKAIPGLNEKLKSLGDSTTKKDRKAKAKELMTLARAEIAKYPAKIDAYKEQPTPDATEKVRVIGELAVRAARVEWLIGTIYLEGSGDKNKWKGGGLSKDEEKLLGNYYEDKVGATDSTVWCTAFLGTIFMTAAGLKTKAGNSPKNGPLWSGYKVGKHGGDANFDFSEDQGGKHVGRSEAKKDESWVKLHNDIEANKDDLKKREAIVDQFFADHFTPQPGDQMIVKRSTNPNANSFTKADPVTKKGGGQSHTTIVERVDGRKIHTIEGNASSRVQGRVYDLTDPTDSGKIVFISRFSLNNFGKKADPKKPKPAFEGQVITEAELLGPIDKLSSVLLGFAQSKGYANTLAEGKLDVVSNLKQGGGNAGVGE